jgi:hypothetical protein
MKSNERRLMCEISIGLCIFLLVAMIPASQVAAQAVDSLPVSAAPQGPDRSGFTLLLTMGVGFQKLDAGRDWGTGLGGLNLGLGGFVSPNLAVLFRFSGTNVRYGEPYEFLGDIVSGFAGPSVQYWASDSFNFEGGLGVGVVGYENGGSRRAVGALLAAGYSFYHKKKSSLQVGIEYSFVASWGGAHNLIIAFGWQLL